MSLWHLLVIIAGCAAFSGSLGALLAMRLDGAKPSLIVGTLAGCVLGVLAAWCLVALRSLSLTITSIDANERTPVWLPLLYGGAVLWIFVVVYLAGLATRALLMAL